MPLFLTSFQARLKIEFSLLLAFSLLVGCLVLLSTQQNREKAESQWVEHTYQVIDQLNAVKALLVDVETGARGYVATRNSLFLEPYYKALPRLSSSLETLPRLVADNPIQFSRAQHLQGLAKAKLDAAGQIVRAGKRPSNALLTAAKQRMDAVRAHIARMIHLEQTLLAKRQQALASTYQTANWLMGLLLVLSLLAFWQAHRLYQQEAARRREAQQNAHRSADLLLKVINNVPTGIVLYDVLRDAGGEIIDFIYRLTNQANALLTGRSIEQMTGGRLKTLFPHIGQGEFFDQLVAVVQTQQAHHWTFPVGEDGVQGWFDGRLAPHEQGVLFTFQDVTVLKQMQLTQQQQAQALTLANQELEHSNARLQSFAAVASHDLQEPLRKIQSFANLLLAQSGGSLSPLHLDYLQRMRSASSRMGQLIQDLLAYARVSSRPGAFQLISMGEVVAGVLEDMETTISDSGVEVVIGDLPRLPGDILQLRQLMQNLLSNAIKFSRGHGSSPQVRVQSRALAPTELPDEFRQRASQEYWEIRVVDTEIGFDVRQLARMFEVFGRLHTRSAYPGSGIGLAICQQVVENHGGYLTAQSAPGEGATFLVYLPADVVLP